MLQTTSNTSNLKYWKPLWMKVKLLKRVNHIRANGDIAHYIFGSCLLYVRQNASTPGKGFINRKPRYEIYNDSISCYFFVIWLADIAKGFVGSTCYSVRLLMYIWLIGVIDHILCWLLAVHLTLSHSSRIFTYLH